MQYTASSVPVELAGDLQANSAQNRVLLRACMAHLARVGSALVEPARGVPPFDAFRAQLDAGAREMDPADAKLLWRWCKINNGRDFR